MRMQILFKFTSTFHAPSTHTVTPMSSPRRRELEVTLETLAEDEDELVTTPGMTPRGSRSGRGPSSVMQLENEMMKAEASEMMSKALASLDSGRTEGSLSAASPRTTTTASLAEEQREGEVSPRALEKKGYVSRLVRARRRSFAMLKVKAGVGSVFDLAMAASKAANEGSLLHLAEEVSTGAEEGAAAPRSPPAGAAECAPAAEAAVAPVANSAAGSSEAESSAAKSSVVAVATPALIQPTLTVITGRRPKKSFAMPGMFSPWKPMEPERDVVSPSDASSESALSPRSTSPVQAKFNPEETPLDGISLMALDDALLLAHDGKRVFTTTGRGFARISRPGNGQIVAKAHSCGASGPPLAPHFGVTAVVEKPAPGDRVIEAAVWDNVFVPTNVLAQFRETEGLTRMPLHIKRRQKFLLKHTAMSRPAATEQQVAFALFQWDDHDGDGYVSFDDVNLVRAEDALAPALTYLEWMALCKTPEWGIDDPARGFTPKKYAAYIAKQPNMYEVVGTVEERRSRFVASATWKKSGDGDEDGATTVSDAYAPDGAVGKVTEFIPGASGKGHDDVYVVETIMPEKVNVDFLKVPLLGWHAENWPQRYTCTRSADVAWQRGDHRRRPDYVWPGLGMRHIKLQLNGGQFTRYSEYLTVDDVANLVFVPRSLPTSPDAMARSYCGVLRSEHELAVAAVSAAASTPGGNDAGSASSRTLEDLCVMSEADRTEEHGAELEQAALAGALEEQHAPPNHVGRASHFVSVCSRTPFNTVVESLGLFGDKDLEHSADYRFWLRSTALLHETSRDARRGVTYWTECIKYAVEAIGHTLVLMAPWRTPSALARAWCTYETVVTLHAKKPMSYIVSPWDYADMMSNVGDVYPDMIASIVKIRFSEAGGSRSDRLQFAAYMQEHGVDATLHLVRTRVHFWAQAMLREALVERDYLGADARTIILIDMLANDLLVSADAKRKRAAWLEEQRLLLIRLKQTARVRTLARMKIMRVGTAEAQLASQRMLIVSAETEAEIERLEREAISRKEEAEAEAVFIPKLKVAKVRTGGKLGGFLRRFSVGGGNSALKEAVAAASSSDAAADEADNSTAPKQRRRSRGTKNKRTVFGTKNSGSLVENEAEKLLRRALEARTQLLGLSHPDTLNSVHNLAMLLGEMERNIESENMHRRALEGRMAEYGIDHPDTLKSLGMLATLLEGVGRLGEASEYFGAAYNVHKGAYGVANATTRAAAKDLTRVLREESRFDEADILLREVLAAAEEAVEDDELTADVVAELGVELSFVVAEQGNLDEAVKLRRSALEVYAKLFGDLDKRTLDAQVALAMLLKERGDLHEAQQLFSQAVTYYEHKKEEMSRKGLVAKSGLATVFRMLGRCVPAEEMFRHCLVGFEALLGKRDACSVACKGNLARTLHQLGKLDEAEPILREMLTIRENALPARDVKILAVCTNLAALLEDRDKFAEARELRLRVLRGFESTRAADNEDTMVARSNYAVCLVKQGMWVEAETPSRVAFEHMKSLLGFDDPSTMNSCSAYIAVLRKLKKFHLAEPLCREMLRLETENKGNNHTDTIHVLNVLGTLVQDSGDLAGAEELYRDAVTRRRRTVAGMEDAQMLTVSQNLAQVLTRLNTTPSLREGKQLHGKVLDGTRELYGGGHVRTAVALKARAAHFRALGNLREAAAGYKAAADVFGSALGMGHPKRIFVVHQLAKVQIRLGRLVNAVASLKAVLTGYREIHGPSGDLTLKVCNTLGLVLTWHGDLREARALLVTALEARRKMSGGDHPATVALQVNVARLQIAQGDLKAAHVYLDEARSTRIKLLGQKHPKTITVLLLQASVLLRLGRGKEAHELAVYVYNLLRSEPGNFVSQYLIAGHIIATVLIQCGRLDEAEIILRECRDRGEMTTTVSFVGTNSLPDVVTVASSLAALLHINGTDAHRAAPGTAAEPNAKAVRCWTEAERIYVHVLHTLEAVVGASDPQVVRCTMNLATLEQDRGCVDKAVKLLRLALTVSETVRGKSDRLTLDACSKLAQALALSGGPVEEVDELATRAATGLSVLLGMDNRHALWANSVVGIVKQPRGGISASYGLQAVVRSYDELVKPVHRLSSTHGWLPRLAPLAVEGRKQVHRRLAGKHLKRAASVVMTINSLSSVATRAASQRADKKRADPLQQLLKEGKKSQEDTTNMRNRGRRKSFKGAVRRGSTAHLIAAKMLSTIGSIAEEVSTPPAKPAAKGEVIRRRRTSVAIPHEERRSQRKALSAADKRTRGRSLSPVSRRSFEEEKAGGAYRGLASLPEGVIGAVVDKNPLLKAAFDSAAAPSAAELAVDASAPSVGDIGEVRAPSTLSQLYPQRLAKPPLLSPRTRRRSMARFDGLLSAAAAQPRQFVPSPGWGEVAAPRTPSN